MLDQFLSIFQQSMHKLNLVQTKLLKEKKNKSGRIFYKFLGKFEFVPPLYFSQDELYKKIQQQKQQILIQLKNFDVDYSNCISHKYTKKVKINDKTQKKYKFNYVFDVVPRNIVDFQINEEKMTLYVIGWGM